MVGIFRRLYDWLLSLFWYVLLLPASVDVVVLLLLRRLVMRPLRLASSLRWGVICLQKYSSDRDTDDLESVDDADWFRDRATEMDITMIGLQNAGKTSLLRVLAVSSIQTYIDILRIS